MAEMRTMAAEEAEAREVEEEIKGKEIETNNHNRRRDPMIFFHSIPKTNLPSLRSSKSLSLPEEDKSRTLSNN